MTFKDIKQGDTVYALNKKEMTLTTGTAVAVAPHVALPGFNTYTGNGQPTVDVTIEHGGQRTPYTIPEGLAVTFAGEDLVLATSAEALAPTLEKAMTDARAVLAKVEHSNMVLEKAPDLLAQINPAMRERRDNERRFAKMEGQIAAIGGKIQQLIDKLS